MNAQVRRLKALEKEKGLASLDFQRLRVEVLTKYLEVGSPSLPAISVLREKLDEAIWKLCFHKFIENFRRALHDLAAPASSLSSSHRQASQSTTSNSVKAAEVSDTFAAFLAKSAEVYTHLLQTLQQRFNIRTEAIVVDSPQQQEVHAAHQLCHRAFIHLGDIARYHKDLRSRSKLNWWAAAQLYYQRAVWIAPDEGDAYNQLAVLSSYKSDVFGALYYYVRAVACKHPDEKARNNVKSLLPSSAGKTSSAASSSSSPSSKPRQVTSFAQLFSFLWSTSSSCSALDFRPWLVNCLQDLNDMLAKPQPDELLQAQLVQLAALTAYSCVRTASSKIIECAASWALSFFRTLLRFMISPVSSLEYLAVTIDENDNANTALHRYLPAAGLLADLLRVHPNLLNPSNPSLDPRELSAFFDELARVANETTSLLAQLKGTQSIIRRAAPYDRDDSSYFLPEELQMRGFSPLWPAAYKHLHFLPSGIVAETNPDDSSIAARQFEHRINKLRAFAIWLAAHSQTEISHTPDTLRFATSRTSLLDLPAPPSSLSASSSASLSVPSSSSSSSPLPLAVLPSSSPSFPTTPALLKKISPPSLAPSSPPGFTRFPPLHSGFGFDFAAQACFAQVQDLDDQEDDEEILFTPMPLTAPQPRSLLRDLAETTSVPEDETEAEESTLGGWFQNGSQLESWMQSFSS